MLCGRRMATILRWLRGSWRAKFLHQHHGGSAGSFTRATGAARVEFAATYLATACHSNTSYRIAAKQTACRRRQAVWVDCWDWLRHPRSQNALGLSDVAPGLKAWKP